MIVICDNCGHEQEFDCSKLRWRVGYVHDSDPDNTTIDYDADWEGCCENCESDLDVSFRTKTDENGKRTTRTPTFKGCRPKYPEDNCYMD